GDRDARATEGSHRGPLLPAGGRPRARGGRGRRLRRLVQGARRPDPDPDPQPARPERGRRLRLRHRRPLPARAADDLPPPEDPARRPLRGRRAARDLHALPGQPRLPRGVPGRRAPDPQRL
ncbi:MAG: Arsenical resistance operon repressor, partial [uncultured Thermomicrobiales bacterium]